MLISSLLLALLLVVSRAFVDGILNQIPRSATSTAQLDSSYELFVTVLPGSALALCICPRLGTSLARSYQFNHVLVLEPVVLFYGTTSLQSRLLYKYP